MSCFRWIDESSQGVSPLYVGLNPGPHHLASALHHLLLANNWLPVTLIVDDSLDAQKIRQVVQQHPSDAGKVMISFCISFKIETFIIILFFLKI